MFFSWQSMVRYITDTANEIQPKQNAQPVLPNTFQLVVGILVSNHYTHLAANAVTPYWYASALKANPAVHTCSLNVLTSLFCSTYLFIKCIDIIVLQYIPAH